MATKRCYSSKQIERMDRSVKCNHRDDCIFSNTFEYENEMNEQLVKTKPRAKEK